MRKRWEQSRESYLDMQAGVLSSIIATYVSVEAMSMALCFSVQAAGRVMGAMTVTRVMPKQYKYVLRGGSSLKVDLHTGAIVEGVLIFFICLALHIVSVRDCEGETLKVCKMKHR
ncbi:hypothetical protein SADUNF_Sadunf08G0012100 [Salix dunnii]|uniref:Uncharacterized protein n=1 Tax=Salix dunnii TaxID=1413687 RepID=A0A835MT13_9ROSI|nr:hypothetical protein SADUNF_Sadunf08G0012100 [Salix dunnii]